MCFIRAGGSYKPPAKVEASQLQQLAEAAVAAPGVQRRTLLSPNRHAPPRRARAVPAPARQATVDAAVPAYVRSTVALRGEAAASEGTDSVRLNLQTHATVGTEPSPSGASPWYAAPAPSVVRSEVPQPESSAQHQWKPASARVGRYFGDGLAGAAEASAQHPALTDGALVSGLGWQFDPLWLVQQSGSTSSGKHTDGVGGDNDATVARLRVGVSRGGDSGLVCWRLLLELLARRAAAMPSPGAQNEPALGPKTTRSAIVVTIHCPSSILAMFWFLIGLSHDAAEMEFITISWP